MLSFNIVTLTCKAVGLGYDRATGRAPDKWRKDQALPYEMRARIFLAHARTLDFNN